MSTMFSTVDKQLILVVFFLNSVVFSDCVSLTLSGSSSHLVKDKQFTLTCTVSGAENLQDRIVFYKEGGSATFASLEQELDQCSVWNPPADRQSYSVECGDGTNSRLSTTKNYSLTINKASDQDVTDWFCQLNSAGGSRKKLTLEMSSGPDSVVFSLPGNVDEGHDLNVNCVAVCKPPCLFSWSLDNQQTESGSELSVTNVRRNQTGQKYTCTVTNRVSAKSLTKSFTLKVHFGPENMKLNRSSPVQIVEGKNVAVSCEADCDEVCSYKWKCQTKEINDAVLSFTQIHRTEAGVCVCIVTNVNTNKSKNKTVILDVQYQTSISSLTLNSQSTKITVDELTHMSLRCKVDSNPASHIKLLNNSHILHEVKNSKSVEYSWNEAGCLDTGFYTCEAGNNIKSDVSQSVQLLVTCSPRLDYRVTFQDKFSAVQGGNVTLHISVIANPVPTFTWYKLTDVNNKSLGPTQPVLTTNVSAIGEYKLANVKQEDFGFYQVAVSNGEARRKLVEQLNLTAEGPPTVPSDVRTWITGPRSVSVSWTEKFNGGSQQTFLVQYRANTTSEWTNLTEQFGEKGLHTNHTAEISSLQPNTRYLIRVLAFNKFGFKEFTKEQEIMTDAAKNPGSSNIVAVAAGVTAGVVVIVTVVVVLLVLFLRQRKQNTTSSDKAVIVNDSNVLYAVVNKIKRAGTSSSQNQQTKENTAEAGVEYALVNKDKKHKVDNKPGPSSSADLYAVVDKTKKPAAVKKQKMKPKEKKKTNDGKHIYGNVNMAFVEDKKSKRPRKGKTEPATAKRRNERQLVYTEVEFTNEKMSQPIHKKEEPTVYIQIDFSKKAPQLSDDDVNTERAND